MAEGQGIVERKSLKLTLIVKRGKAKPKSWEFMTAGGEAQRPVFRGVTVFSVRAKFEKKPANFAYFCLILLRGCLALLLFVFVYSPVVKSPPA